MSPPPQNYTIKKKSRKNKFITPKLTGALDRCMIVFVTVYVLQAILEALEFNR